MRIRARGPSGVSTITLEPSQTVRDLKTAIQEATAVPDFDLKCGYPPRSLDITEVDAGTKLSDIGIKLDGEQLIVMPREIQSKLENPVKTRDHVSFQETSDPHPARQTPNLLPLQRKQTDVESDPPELPLASRDGTLVLRVMPDDNSCMFRALSSAVLGSLDSMTELRSAVAQGIQANPELYGEAMLQQKPDDYCQWIQMESSWGGGIELSILSQHFEVEICSINVQDLRVDRFNEGKPTRCILVYSGIHYDTIALNPSSPPHTRADAPPDFDVKIFDSFDDAILEKARDLCRLLQGKHYYTDTAGFSIKCNDCGWIGNGEQGATQHAKETGHYNFGEADS
ncbi:zinc finger protein [Viridothelium virens]|uniref:Ubiquitin thioesterase OTU n=1 Tax=Viridothelium virens TaxID=1048519 RepID=A0A6A6HMZ8_VIRVR|nr:zinc finger protein [Viridothelium virens]